MERFCEKCGSLVSGDGGFCTSCGAPMGNAFGGSQSGGVDLSKGGSMPSTSDPVVPTPSGSSYQPIPTYSQPQTNYQQPNYQQTNYSQPAYGQTVYANNNAQNQEMTVGQWFLTIFLSSLGIIGLILLFVWAFSADTPTSKKNYARAMLIMQAIAFVLSFIMVPIFFGIIYGVVEEIGSSYMGYQFSASLLMNLLVK